MDDRSTDRDHDLRERIRRAYAAREAGASPRPFQTMWDQIERRAPVGSPPPGGGWPRPLLALAASAVAVVWLLTWLDRDEDELDQLTRTLTSTVTWRSPTDELLELGANVDALSTLPTIDFPTPAPEWNEPEERS